MEFGFRSEEAVEAWRALLKGMSGDEPCVSDPDLYSEGWSKYVKNENIAEELCFECPVKELCLDFALKNKEKQGIYGGTTPIQRGAVRDVKRRRG